MGDASIELRRRRDRGKAAQRAFRKRQSDKAADLRLSHDRLQRLVREIILTHGQDDRDGLGRAIAEAACELGIEVAEPLRLPEERGTCNPCESIVAETATPVSTHHAGFNFSTQQQQQRPGRFSPRLDYSLLWLEPDRFIKIFDPPSDIRPYIGPGKDTIAGHIMWACLDHGLAVLRSEMISGNNKTNSNDDNIVRMLSPPARHLFQSALGHSEHLHDIRYILALIEARQEFRRSGFMRSDEHGGADEVKRAGLEHAVLEGLRLRGVEFEMWWTALQVEAYIRTVMGVLEFSKLQSAVRDTQQAAEIERVRLLAQRLAPKAVCFGSGPRWNAAYVMGLVKAWLDVGCR